MKNDKFQCEGCGRNCYITLGKEKDRYFIEGNKCIGGEEQAKENWTFLQKQDSIKKEENKKGIFRKLFTK